MHWIFIALVPPLLWAMVNNIDKFLLSKYLKVEGPGALIVFSSIAGALVLPVAYLFSNDIFSFPIVHISTLIFGGILSALALYFYFLALFDEDVSTVVPLLQIVPIFGFILGFIILGEKPGLFQIAASLIIIAGAFILSSEKNEHGSRIKKRLVLLMLGSSFFFALYDALFKFVAIREDFWISIFWQNLGLFLVGIFFLLFNAKYRKDFLFLIRSNGTRILSLNLLNESFTLFGNVTFAYASLLAPIGLVMTVGSYQPIFVIIIAGIVSSIMRPSSSDYKKESVTTRKILAIAVIVGGSLFLYM